MVNNEIIKYGNLYEREMGQDEFHFGSQILKEFYIIREDTKGNDQKSHGEGQQEACSAPSPQSLSPSTSVCKVLRREYFQTVAGGV